MVIHKYTTYSCPLNDKSSANGHMCWNYGCFGRNFHLSLNGVDQGPTLNIGGCTLLDA